MRLLAMKRIFNTATQRVGLSFVRFWDKQCPSTICFHQNKIPSSFIYIIEISQKISFHCKLFSLYSFLLNTWSIFSLLSMHNWIRRGRITWLFCRKKNWSRNNTCQHRMQGFRTQKCTNSLFCSLSAVFPMPQQQNADKYKWTWR